jgi:glycosyltransferase involved in cell wall biosynthesis
MEPRVLLVAENVSVRFGGEAFLPVHYFRLLRKRGIQTHLLTHARVRDELLETFPAEADRMHFVPDTAAHKLLWRAGSRLPQRIDTFTLGAASHMLSQVTRRRMARQLIRQHGLNIVHEPTPVSPKAPSAMFDLGAPVIIGPMNGGMTYPPAFKDFPSSTEDHVVVRLRHIAHAANLLIPGKRRASALLVANTRSRRALEEVVSEVPVHVLVENGVDLTRFQLKARRARHAAPVRFAFVGRLVDWKAVGILLDAMARAARDTDLHLEIFGDGDERSALIAQAKRLQLESRVHFHGFVEQSQIAARLAELDALVLPSLYECGGAVVLEAMAVGLPVIATRWGGPVDYLDDSCGVLIEPNGREGMVTALSAAMRELAADPEKRERMGLLGRAKVEREYDWERKIDRMLELYRKYAS